MSTTNRERDAVTDDVVDFTPGTQAISVGVRAEIDVQIATAKRFPRNVDQARDFALSMATVNEEVAASCCYSLARGGKAIKGPSIRLAEIMVQAWGNIRAETRVLNADHLTIESEGVCWDLERNVAIRAAVKRRITNREGKRYNDDMIVTTGNAASSIAFRNAVFRVIPKTFVFEVYDQCELVAVGDIKTLGQRRATALEYFARFGINAEQVCKRMLRASVTELTLDDVAQLKAMAEQVKRGDLSIEDAFAEPVPEATAVGGDAMQQAKEAVRRASGRTAESKATETPSEASEPAEPGQDAPGRQEETKPEVVERREKVLKDLNEAKKDEKKPKVPTCSPNKDGCVPAGAMARIGKKDYWICNTHAKDFGLS